MNSEHKQFLTYLNTRYYLSFMVGKYSRPKDTYIYIPLKEIDQRFFPFPTYKAKEELNKLVSSGEIEIKKNTSEKGYYYSYKPLKGGDINFDLVSGSKSNLTPLHKQMVKYLKRATLPSHVEATDYYQRFIRNRKKHANLFFIVDSFAKRVHTPFSNLKKELRPHLLIDGDKTCAIDVVTMQPLILGKVLFSLIGKNEFSELIEKGTDVYHFIMDKVSNSITREKAKKIFFNITFGWPSSKVAQMFGSANWVQQVNHLKRTDIPQNPKTLSKPHSNLAWLLQNHEVQTMTKVWKNLASKHIPFLTVHDEVICKESDLPQAEKIFHDVLSNEYEFYRIKTTTKPKPDSKPLPIWTQDMDKESLWWFFLDEPTPTEPIAIDENSYITNFNEYVSKRINDLDNTTNYNDLNLLAQYLTYTQSINNLMQLKLTF